MSLASYKARVFSQGRNIQESTAYDTKRLQVEYILNSPSRSDVLINLDETISHPCIVSDTKTFQLRRFLFLPDMKVGVGDYICHDGFIYLITDQTTDSKFPQCFGQVCNFEYPIRTTTEKILIGYETNGKPIYEYIDRVVTIPSVLTENNYTVIDDNPIPLPDSTAKIYLPYYIHDEIGFEINKTIKDRHAQFRIVDYVYGKVFPFNGADKGCLEIKLDRVQRT